MNTSVMTDCLAAVQPVLKIQQHAVKSYLLIYIQSRKQNTFVVLY